MHGLAVVAMTEVLRNWPAGQLYPHCSARTLDCDAHGMEGLRAQPRHSALVKAVGALARDVSGPHMSLESPGLR